MGASEVFTFLRSYKGRATAAYAFAYALLGLVIASIGPTLTHLADQTGADLADLGFLFPARSAAYLVGSAAGGPIFDRFPGHVVIWTTMLMTAVATAAMPFMPSVPLLALCVAFQGLSMGFLDTGGNVSLVWLHGGDKVAPFMQLIHFAFGLGAFLCPLVVEASLEIGGSYKWSFWVFALLYVPSAISIMVLPSPKPTPNADAQTNIARKRTPRELVLVFIGASILALYVGAEVSMGGYAYSYFVVFLGRSGPEGDYLTSAFWGALAFGRLMAIPISIYVSARTMLLVNMTFSALSVTAIWIFTGVVELVWVGSVIFGLSMASTYPSTLNMMEHYVNLSGKITSVLVVGGALGEMLVPLTLALLFREEGHWSDLMPVLSIVSIGTLCLLVLFIFIGRPVLNSKTLYNAVSTETRTDLELAQLTENATADNSTDDHLQVPDDEYDP